MEIINITNPGEEPVDGDFVEYRFDNGNIARKYYYAPVPPLDPPAPSMKVKCGVIVGLFEDSEIVDILTLAATNNDVKALEYRFRSDSDINVLSARFDAIVNRLYVNNLIGDSTKNNLLALKE